MRKLQVASKEIVKKNYEFKKVSTSKSACFKIALNVPSGISPEWLGIVVNLLLLELYQIS